MKVTPEIVAIWQKSGRSNLRTKVADLLASTERLVESQENRGMATERAMGMISALTWVMSEIDKQDN
jgi:hypothetical protein